MSRLFSAFPFVALLRALYALGALALLLTAFALQAPSASTVFAHGTDVDGYVYLNDNTAVANTVAGFARHDDGSLTALSGSPFAVGGAGNGVVTPSQGSLKLTRDGRYLLVVDTASNQISLLHVRSNGSLQAVKGSPVASGGIEPVSIAVNGRLVYVANEGDSTHAPTYVGFTFDHGKLSPLANATISLPIGSQPGDVLFNDNGTRLIGTRVATSLIDSFVVGYDGRLTAAVGSPYAAQAAGPFGSSFRPGYSTQLFVSNAHAGAGAGSISAFYDGAHGALTPIGASPYADSQTAPCWVTITPNGKYLFAVNTGSGTISSFHIASNGTLTLLGSVAITGGNALGSFDIQVSPDGDYAYVVDARGDSVSAFRVDGGTLTELATSPVALPAGATPFGVAVL